MTTIEPHEPIIQRAFMALMGFSPDWREDLVPLLRSDRPIPPFLRDILADAIEGRSFTGVSLKLHGQQRLANWLTGVKDRRRWVEIGTTILEDYNASGDDLFETLERAAERLPESEGTCKRAFYYFKRCTAWMEQARSTGHQYAAMDDDQLASIYHFASASKVEPMSGSDYDRTSFDTVNWLNESVRPKLGQNAVKVIWALCHVEPFSR